MRFISENVKLRVLRMCICAVEYYYFLRRFYVGVGVVIVGYRVMVTGVVRVAFKPQPIVPYASVIYHVFQSSTALSRVFLSFHYSQLIGILT